MTGRQIALIRRIVSEIDFERELIRMIRARTIYTVPLHVGQYIEVPKGSIVTEYEPGASAMDLYAAKCSICEAKAHGIIPCDNPQYLTQQEIDAACKNHPERMLVCYTKP